MLASTIPWKKLAAYLVVAVLIANASRFLAYAAAGWYASLTHREIDQRQVADETFHTVGALGLLGVFIVLAWEAAT
jgi:hypothetical protein